jgi:hypothetical protein
MAELPWGWWRSDGRRSPELALVLADWLEERRQSRWAGWFRSEADEQSRISWFFGDRDPVEVYLGAMPVAIPGTSLAGPWFTTVHVVRPEPDAFDFQELADVPCMGHLSQLVLHRGAMRGLGAREPVQWSPVDPAELAPLADSLTGLWVLGDILPDDLAALHRLEVLHAGLGPGDHEHPTLRSLSLHALPDARAMLRLPALRSLDVDLQNSPADGLGDLLGQLPSLELLEVDADVLQQVAHARAAGALPRLQSLRVWGAGGSPVDVPVFRAAPWTRQNIRITSDWIVDRAIALPP